MTEADALRVLMNAGPYGISAEQEVAVKYAFGTIAPEPILDRLHGRRELERGYEFGLVFGELVP